MKLILIALAVTAAIALTELMKGELKKARAKPTKTTTNKRKNVEHYTEPPYKQKPELLHDGEQAVFHKLKDALPDHHVMAQVHLEEIVRVNDTENNPENGAWRAKISQKRVDFAICDQRFRVVACVEYDGHRHGHGKQKQRDDDKDLALQTAGIPIIRWKPQDVPKTCELIRQAVLRNP